MTLTLSHLSLWSVLVVVAVIGAGPVVAMRILGRAWPKDHLRRQELVAEVKALPYRDRVFFVAEMLETALVEGLPQRLRPHWRRIRAIATPKTVMGVLLLAAGGTAVLTVGVLPLVPRLHVIEATVGMTGMAAILVGIALFLHGETDSDSGRRVGGQLAVALTAAQPLPDLTHSDPTPDQ